MVDLRVNVSGPSRAGSGDPFSYTMIISENSLADAGGATFTNTAPAGATDVAASCEASDGASCPATLAVSGAAVSGTAPALPHLGTVTVTVTGHFANPSASSVVDVAHVDPPDGTTDSDLTSNDSQVGTDVSSSVDVQTTFSQSEPTIGVDHPETYTVTLTNHGPATASSVRWFLYQTVSGEGGSFDTFDVLVLSCTGTGGVSCPDNVLSDGRSTAIVSSTVVDSLPAGALLTLVYEVSPVSSGEAACGSGDIGLVGFSTGTAMGATDADPANDRADLSTDPDPVPPCPVADLETTFSQSEATIGIDHPETYTVTLTNHGPATADGTRWNMFQSLNGAGGSFDTFDVHVVSCTGTGGVSCPDDILPDGPRSAVVLGATIGAFPAGAALTLVYEISPVSDGEAACGSGEVALTGFTRVSVASGRTDDDPGNNYAALTTDPDPVPPCPTSDLEITWTQSGAVIGVGEPETYTVTVTNHGPAAADGTRWTLYQFPGGSGGSFDSVDVHVLSCTGTGGVSCPSNTLQDGRTSFLYLSTTLDAFPAGSALTVVYQVSPVSSGTPGCGSGTPDYVGQSSLQTPTGRSDDNPDNNHASIATPTPCHDISVNQTVSPASVQSGQTATFETTVSSSGGRGRTRGAVQ